MLEKHLGYGHDWIQRHFVRAVGLSPHQYLLNYRIEEAQRLMLSGDTTMTDVALECGFSSSQHFSASFKRITGITPTQCLKKQRAGKS